jgi:hypothetical protein
MDVSSDASGFLVAPATLIVAGLSPSRRVRQDLPGEASFDANGAAAGADVREHPVPLAHPRPLAALALHHLVALLEQSLALAILAFLLFLDVGALFIGHGSLPATDSLLSP